MAMIGTNKGTGTANLMAVVGALFVCSWRFVKLNKRRTA